MSSLVFTRRMDAHSRCVLSSDATLSDGRYLAIHAARSTGLVELGLSYSSDLVSHQSLMAFTPEQARVLAAELVACADAHTSGAMPGGVK